MTALALRGTPNPEQGEAHRKANRSETAPSIGQLCPDELRVLREIRQAGGSIKPSKLHAIYERVTANADADFDFGAHVLTYLSKTRHASIPADIAVGERAVRRIERNRHS